MDLKDPQLMDKVSKGERVYKRIEAKYNFPIMFGWQARDITLMIPTKDWNGLSKEEKVNLTYYAQKLVIDIKENPKPYVDRWTRYYKVTEQLERGGEYDGLTQNSYIQAAADVCSVCWSITNGTVKGKAFYDDETVVKGDNVQEFRDSMGK